ncbi:MAG TPA: hypothetical protein PLX71_08570 [Phycicoccus sp.]|nr:hypothetical protein [Phycicoccus sp.]
MLPPGLPAASFERRALTRLATVAATLVLLAPVGMIKADSAGQWVAFVWLFVVGAGQMVLMIVRGYEIGSWVTGVTQVTMSTGKPGGVAVFLKFLLQNVVSSATCGLGGIVTLILRPPLNQNWFDRVAGVVVVETRPPWVGPSPR